MKELYPNFHIDEVEYRLSEIYWDNLIVRATEGHVHGLWEKFFSTRFADGRPMGEDNNIGGAKCITCKKAVVISQSKYSTPPFIGAGVDKFGEDDEDTGLDLLSIDCVLTEETGQLAEQLIKEWSVSERTGEEMERLIVEVLNRKF